MGQITPAPDADLTVPDADLAAPDADLAAPDADLAAPDADLAAPDADLAAFGCLETGGTRRVGGVRLRLCWVRDGGWVAGVQGSKPAEGVPDCQLEVPPVILSRLELWRPNQNPPLKLRETGRGKKQRIVMKS